jgi:hypothetical protein
MSGKFRQIATDPSLWCAVAIAVCVLASHPFLEMGFDDDFSYIWTAKALATTGHVVYNNWATAMLGWQLYLGALFIKVFGFSFSTVRFSVLLVAMVTGVLLQRLFIRLGVNSWNATLATLTLTTSPLYLPLAFSFMTDIPGFLAILVCVYCCVRAIQATSDRSTLVWLIFAAASNAIGGTARQISWLGVLVLVPSTAWVLRKRSGVLVLTGAVWVLSVGFIAGCMAWFKRQPNSVNEPLAVHFHFFSHKYLAIPLLTLPVLIAFLWHYPFRERWARVQAGIAAASIVIPIVLYRALKAASFREHSKYLLAPFSDGEVTVKGFDIGSLAGTRPDVLPLWVQFGLTILTLSSLFAFLLFLINSSRLRQKAGAAVRPTISSAMLTKMLAPFTVAYLALMITRAAMFERYFLPMLFVLLVFALRFYQARVAPYLPKASVVLVALYAALGVVTLHDFIASSRARLEAADHLLSAGVPRSEIRAGFEYDGWTQIELAGHLAPKKRTPQLPKCAHWWESDTPSINGRYELSYEKTCFPQSEFPAVEYQTWLPPHLQSIYTLRMSH